LLKETAVRQPYFPDSPHTINFNYRLTCTFDMLIIVKLSHHFQF